MNDIWLSGKVDLFFEHLLNFQSLIEFQNMLMPVDLRKHKNARSIFGILFFSI